jgi:hypothetical protein
MLRIETHKGRGWENYLIQLELLILGGELKRFSGKPIA